MTTHSHCAWTNEGGHVSITPRLDAVLHRVLGSEPGYWLACNQRYRRSLGVRSSD